MIQREFRAMGSRVLAILDCEATHAAANQLDCVPVWFEEWERLLSRFRIDSELSHLNVRSGSKCRVSQTVWDVLEVSLEAEALTNGLVNPLVLEAVIEAGYDRTFDLLEAEGNAPAIMWHAPAPFVITPPWLASASSIEMDAPARAIRVPEGFGLDFGGVAKGWAAHQAVCRLNAGHASSLVSAGGDVQVSGPRASGEPWRIGVEDPAQRERYVEMLYLERGGVATSGKDHRHWKRGGVLQHHIIDPRTMQPALTDVTAATVVAANVMRAEALAKAALISGSEAGLQLLDDQADVEGILILDDGRRLYSRNVGYYL